MAVVSVADEVYDESACEGVEDECGEYPKVLHWLSILCGVVHLAVYHPVSDISLVSFLGLLVVVRDLLVRRSVRRMLL